MLTTTAQSNGKTKKERLAQEIAKAVGAGRPVAVETVNFDDPNRPKTCLEVDFPILPINQISQIEGNAGKPIYREFSVINRPTKVNERAQSGSDILFQSDFFRR